VLGETRGDDVILKLLGKFSVVGAGLLVTVMQGRTCFSAHDNPFNGLCSFLRVFLWELRLNKPQRTYCRMEFTFISAVRCWILCVAGQVQFLSEASRDSRQRAGKVKVPSAKPAAEQVRALNSENWLITPCKLQYRRNVHMKLISFWENVLWVLHPLEECRIVECWAW
jgi:hypothetical protein